MGKGREGGGRDYSFKPYFSPAFFQEWRKEGAGEEGIKGGENTLFG